MPTVEIVKRRGRPCKPITNAPNRLRDFRLGYGMTVAEVASYLGISASAVVHAERHRTKTIGSDNWDRLAVLFNTDPRILKDRSYRVVRS